MNYYYDPEYEDYNIHGGGYGNDQENMDEQKYQKKCFKQKQKQTEAEALELTYSHLGRLIQSAEILAFKLNIIEKNSSLKYQSYDYFKVADKKDIDTIKYDIINYLDFYEKAIILHNKQYKYVQPKSITTIINDLTNWENKASYNDKRFFKNILSLILNGNYNESDFPDQQQ